MGVVYKARDPGLDRAVALKTISAKAIEKPDVRARFEREARAAARLQHPNIVTIFELGEVNGAPYIAMELLEGSDLAETMRLPERLTSSQRLRIVVDICRGLDYAHKRGVLHRDVKPANVRVLKDTGVKIVDFGIARLDDAAMTQTGIVLGTPSYMAPETLRGVETDHRADMWAVGVLLYELLEGRRPFRADGFEALAYQIVHEVPPPLSAPLPGPPGQLAAIVLRALAKKAGDRFRDLAEMGDALELVLGLTPGGERPLAPAARHDALTLHLQAAQRLRSEDALEAALNEARRAQALDPSNGHVVALVRELEERLSRDAANAPTVVMKAPELPRAAPAATAAPADGSAGLLEALKERGASLFHELALFGEPAATSTACLSPVRDVLATAGTDGAIRLWDIGSRRRVSLLRTAMHQRTGHEAAVLSLAFSRDGRLLAAGHVDGVVRLWDLAGAAEIPVKLRHDAMVSSVAFSPDGQTLASGGIDSNLKLWEVRAALAGEARRELIRQPFSVTALAYAGDGGSLLVTGHAKAVLRVLDAGTGRLVATLRGPDAQISLLVGSPDGRRLAVLSQDRMISVFDIATRKSDFQREGHRTKQTTSLAFFPGGRLAASVALDNSVQLWDVATRASLATLWGQTGESYAWVALASGGTLAVALADGRVRVWGRVR
jgi:WD40 repeat protein